MAVSARLEIRQGQQLVMTPQLQQAIRLLQLSNLELTEFVDAELERNPLLEREDHGDAPALDEPAVDFRNDGDGGGENGKSDDWLDLAKPTGEAAAALDADMTNVFPDAAPAELNGADPALSNWASVPSWLPPRARAPQDATC